MLGEARIATTLTFTGRASGKAAIASSPAAPAVERVAAGDLDEGARASESRRTLRRIESGVDQPRATRASWKPFVVTDRSSSPGIAGEHRAEVDDSLADERLATGQPHIAGPDPHQEARRAARSPRS